MMRLSPHCWHSVVRFGRVRHGGTKPYLPVFTVGGGSVLVYPRSEMGLSSNDLPRECETVVTNTYILAVLKPTSPDEFKE